MATLTQGAIAEAIGTFALVFVGAGSIVVGATVFADGGFTHADLLAIALAHGLTIFAMVNAFGHISGGQFNPAVSLGLLVARKQDARMTGVFVLAQLAGAALGALLLAAVAAGWADAGAAATGLGIPAVRDGVSSGVAILVEAVLTFFLVMVVMGTIDSRSQARVGGLAIGMTVALDILVGGPITGAAMNTARWFGPALATGSFSGTVVFLVGPLLGGALAGLLYGYVLADKPMAHPGHGG